MGFYFSISIFIVMIIFSIAFFFKKNVINLETKIYTHLIIVSLIMSLLEIITGYWYTANYDINNDIYSILAKMVPMCYVILNSLFCKYLLWTCYKKKFMLTIVDIIVGIVLISMAASPIAFIENNNSITPTGLSLAIALGFCGISMLYQIFLCIKFRKKVSVTKLIPYYSFIVLGVLNFLITIFIPSAFFIGYLFCITIIIMYFTLENPDVKMLEEFRIAKDRAEKANEEKEIFLYNITQDIREPLSEITKASNWLNENTKNKNVTDATYYINKNASNITDLVNSVLDISTLELTNIKVYNTSYNINNINKFIEKTYKEKMNEKVEFRMNVDSNIPTALYGDQIRLKQAIQIIIENAIKYTKTGFIDYTVNCIEKNKLCRLLISVEDSGSGIKPSEMEQILNKEEHLIKNEKIDDKKSTIAMAKSIVNLLGGTLLIDSELGSGTRMTIVLDQKIYDKKSLELNKIEKDVDKFIDNTKVLVVVEDEEYREKVVKKLARYNLDLEVVELGSECLDNIRMSKKYNLIIMDESLSHLSSIEIITKLKAIPSFNIPVALLTDNTDNNGYINNGFTYLIDRKLPSKELEEVIEKVEK